MGEHKDYEETVSSFQRVGGNNKRLRSVLVVYSSSSSSSRLKPEPQQGAEEGHQRDIRMARGRKEGG